MSPSTSFLRRASRNEGSLARHLRQSMTTKSPSGVHGGLDPTNPSSQSEVRRRIGDGAHFRLAQCSDEKNGSLDQKVDYPEDPDCQLPSRECDRLNDGESVRHRSSKPAGRSSPPLGWFDSIAAPWEEVPAHSRFVARASRAPAYAAASSHCRNRPGPGLLTIAIRSQSRPQHPVKRAQARLGPRAHASESGHSSHKLV
jgi:hypothetical protein